MSGPFWHSALSLHPVAPWALPFWRAVLGGGGAAAISSVFAGLIGENQSHYLQEQLENGDILLWVRTRDSEHEHRARSILSRQPGHDVHVHGIPDHAAGLRSHYKKPLELSTGPLKAANYHDVEILKADDGHCFAGGREFATEANAKRFIREIEYEG